MRAIVAGLTVLMTACSPGLGGERMRCLVVVILGLLVVGCSGVLDTAEIKECEAAALRDVRTPATYRRVSAESVRIADANRRYQSVRVVFDAQNIYGALVRETKVCAYPIDGADIRTDLFAGSEGGELGDALAGRGLFSAKAKFVSRQQREAEMDEEADRIMNDTAEH